MGIPQSSESAREVSEARSQWGHVYCGEETAHPVLAVCGQTLSEARREIARRRTRRSGEMKR